MPVVVGFHGCGSGNKGTAQNTAFEGHFDGTDSGDNYVRALPLSINDGSCALFTELVDNYCVDLDRVFGVGHSYGAGFLMGMTPNAANFDHFGFRGIAPVAGWEIASANIQVPMMYVQRITHTERDNSDGANVSAKVAHVKRSIVRDELSWHSVLLQRDGLRVFREPLSFLSRELKQPRFRTGSANVNSVNFGRDLAPCSRGGTLDGFSGFSCLQRRAPWP